MVGMPPMEGKTGEEYEAMIHRVGFRDLSDRGKIEVRGADRVTFLHALISNEVKGLADCSGLHGTLLTPTGKIISDFYYYRLADFILMDLQADLLARTMQTLEKYIIMDDVQLQDASHRLAHFSLHGPRSPELLQDLFHRSGPSVPYRIEEAGWEGAPVWIIRKSEITDCGYEMVASRTAPSLRGAILELGRERYGLREVGPEAYNVLRVEALVPRYGIEIDENRYPMEARLGDALSLTKGCYMGQEVVSRATHLGGVPWLLSGLKIKGEAVPSQGARVLGEEGKQIGTVTSGVFSPRLQTPIALAYLKRALAQAGLECQVEIASQGVFPAQVVEKFI